VNSVFEQVIVISHVGETREAVDQAIELVHDADAGLTRIRA
jgi:DNA repair exonuclease SbcCD ATPase subunit